MSRAREPRGAGGRARRDRRVLAPYGGVGAYGREDQLHRFLTDEIRQIRTMSRITPTIFLGVAAFLLNIVLTRLVPPQRSQIGTLKAFGYSGARSRCTTSSSRS